MLPQRKRVFRRVFNKILVTETLTFDTIQTSFLTELQGFTFSSGLGALRLIEEPPNQPGFTSLKTFSGVNILGTGLEITITSPVKFKALSIHVSCGNYDGETFILSAWDGDGVVTNTPFIAGTVPIELQINTQTTTLKFTKGANTGVRHPNAKETFGYVNGRLRSLGYQRQIGISKLYYVSYFR